MTNRSCEVSIILIFYQAITLAYMHYVVYMILEITSIWVIFQGKFQRMSTMPGNFRHWWLSLSDPAYLTLAETICKHQHTRISQIDYKIYILIENKISTNKSALGYIWIGKNRLICNIYFKYIITLHIFNSSKQSFGM